MARHHCMSRACARLAAPATMRPLPENPFARPRPSFATCASRAADPDPVAGADRRARHRPLRLFAGAAGHARFAGLVVFGRGLHEHHQCRRLSRRRVAGLEADQAIRPVRGGALGNAGLRAVAGAVRHIRQFRRLELCAAAGRRRRGAGIRCRRRAGGDDRAIAAGAGEFSAQSVLCRARARHPRLRPDRAFRAAGVRPGLVVDRVVGDDVALDGDDPSAAADADRRQRGHRRHGAGELRDSGRS